MLIYPADIVNQISIVNGKPSQVIDTFFNKYKNLIDSLSYETFMATLVALRRTSKILIGK